MFNFAHSGEDILDDRLELSPLVEERVTLLAQACHGNHTTAVRASAVRLR